MRRENHPNIKALSWYLDLVNAKLEEESNEDIYRRLFEASLRFDWTPEGSEPYNLPSPEEMKSLYSGPKGRAALKALQEGLRSLLEDARVGKAVPLGRYHLTLTRGNVSLRWQVETRVLPEKGTRPKTVWIPAAKVLLACTLANLPEGLPPHPIDRCAECGNFFVRVSRKPKMYCTARCTSVSLSRKKRGEPGSTAREAYNLDMKKIMRKSRRI